MLESSSYDIGGNQYNKKAHNSELVRQATILPGKQRQQGVSHGQPRALITIRAKKQISERIKKDQR